MHRRNDTFPAEEALAVAVRALDVAALDDPLLEDGVLVAQLPREVLRGRHRQHMGWCLLAVGARRGGIEPDLLGDPSSWTECFWLDATCVAVAVVRACAARTGTTVADFVTNLDPVPTWYGDDS